MSHFTRAEPLGTWVNGYNPTPADFESFDNRQAAAIDGDNGGAWAPTSVMVIGGIGAVPGVQLTGPLVIAYGGSLTSNTATPFNCLDNDFPTLGAGHAGATRVVQYSFASALGDPFGLWNTVPCDASMGQALDVVGIQAWSCAFDQNDGRGVQPLHAYLPFRPHNGSTLSSMAISFRVAVDHPQVPQTMPKARVLREDHDGNVVTLTSTAAGADTNGFVSVSRPTTGAIWRNGGAPQSFTIPCDQNNVIDVSLYTYTVEVVDELYDIVSWPFVNATSGATSPATWAATTVYGANATVVPAAATNWFFIAATTAGGTSGSTEPIWPRSLPAKGTAVTVTDGTVTWLCSSPIAAPPQNAPGVLTAFYRGFGTIWTGATATFTGITDTRFQ